jgi:hypothetical protein
MSDKEIAKLLDKHKKELLSLPGVVGAYVENLPESQASKLTLMVLRETEDIRSVVAKYFSGFQVSIEECAVDYKFR